MEWKIGEIRQVDGKWHQCVIASGGCFGCSFREPTACTSKFECFACKRNDHKSVIFRKLEKVEKPFLIRYGDNSIIKYQRYKIYAPFIIGDTSIRYSKVGNLLQLDIEIKQNKEDMEEKKQNCDGCKYSDEEMKTIERAEKDVRKAMGGAFGLPKDIPYLHSFVSSALELGWLDKYTEHSNSEKIGKDLKPFDLEAAKAGKPVCTRDGRKARIICFDRKYLYEGHDYSIIALINEGHYNETVYSYTKEGLYESGKSGNSDLMMLPEKKEGWVNVYKVGARIETGRSVYSTKDDAIKCIDSGKKHIATVKIEWEE